MLFLDKRVPEFDDFFFDVGEDKRQRMFLELDKDGLLVVAYDQFFMKKVNSASGLYYNEIKYKDKLNDQL